MKKIAVDLLGPGEIVSGNHNFGLGNQLFQIAAALSYANDNDFKAIFPCLRNKNYYGNYTDNILRKLIISEDIPSDHVKFSNPQPVYKAIPSSDKSILVYGSYLQSEKYFSNNQNLIRDTFSPSKTDKEYLLKKYPNVSNSVSCHIRRGDYSKLKDKYFTLTESDYYQNAIKLIGDEPMIIFSDDIDWCVENFKSKSSQIYFSNEKDYLEIYLMSMCKHNIIANSTFSWWGAWLNKNKDKKVIAPSSWFTPQQKRKDVDLIPQDWTLI